MRWFVLHQDVLQEGGRRGLGMTHILSNNDRPNEAWFDAPEANEAIRQAALVHREGGTYYAINFDTLIVAEGVELEMAARVPGIRAASVNPEE